MIVFRVRFFLADVDVQSTSSAKTHLFGTGANSPSCWSNKEIKELRQGPTVVVRRRKVYVTGSARSLKVLENP